MLFVGYKFPSFPSRSYDIECNQHPCQLLAKYGNKQGFKLLGDAFTEWLGKDLITDNEVSLLKDSKAATPCSIGTQVGFLRVIDKLRGWTWTSFIFRRWAMQFAP